MYKADSKDCADSTGEINTRFHWWQILSAEDAMECILSSIKPILPAELKGVITAYQGELECKDLYINWSKQNPEIYAKNTNAQSVLKSINGYEAEQAELETRRAAQESQHEVDFQAGGRRHSRQRRHRRNRNTRRH